MANNFIMTADQIASIQDRIGTLEDRAKNQTSAKFYSTVPKSADGVGPINPAKTIYIVPAAQDSLKIWAAKITFTGTSGKNATITSSPIEMQGINMDNCSLNVTLSVATPEALIPVVTMLGPTKFTITICAANPPSKGNKINASAVTANIIAIGYGS